MKLPFRPAIRLIPFAMVVALLAASCSGSTSSGARMAYSELVQHASQGEVESVVQEGTDLTVALRGEATERTVLVSEQLDVWQQLCAAAGTEEAGACAIRYEFREASTTGSLAGLLISSLLPVLLIGGFIFFMMRRAQATPRP